MTNSEITFSGSESFGGVNVFTVSHLSLACNPPLKLNRHNQAGNTTRKQHMGMSFNWGPFGGHHLGGESCSPITFEVVPC